MGGMILDRSVRPYRRSARALLLCVVALSALGSVAHAQPMQRDIVLVLDNSGSMRKNDPNFLTSIAVRAFIEGLDDDYHVGIVAFDEHATVLKPLAALDASHRAALLASLSSINYRGLLTNSPAAIETSIYELRTKGRPGAEKSIIFMTDGIVDVAPEGADEGDVEKARWMKSTLADEAADRAVRIFGIAFTGNADFELIQTLAKRTGGEYFRAYTAAEIDGVFTRIRDRLAASVAARGPRPVNIVIQPTSQPTPEPATTPTPEATTTPATELPTVEITNETPKPAETALPGASLPSASLPVVALPEISLPAGGAAPVVKLPEVSLGAGVPPAPDTTQPDSTVKQTTTQTLTDPPPVPKPPSDPSPGANQASKEQSKSDATPPLVVRSEAPDESKFYIALMVGAAAILLALASLIFVLMRRKPAAAALADSLMPKAFLNDIAGCTGKPSYEVGAKPIVIGRLQGPDSEAADYIVIEEATIGRRHALIDYKEHSFWVTDQNSLNGTFVNNTRAEGGVRLKHGDRIRFHKHEFEFLVLDMFETDRTMMSETVFADLSSSVADGDEDDDATLVRIVDENEEETSDEEPTVTRL